MVDEKRSEWGKKGGAPKGNKNAVRHHHWRKALERALAEFDKTVDGERIKEGDAINAIARTVIRQAIKGDIACIKEIGDRLDGRPKQAIDFGENDSLKSITVEFVRAKKT